MYSVHILYREKIKTLPVLHGIREHLHSLTSSNYNYKEVHCGMCYHFSAWVSYKKGERGKLLRVWVGECENEVFDLLNFLNVHDLVRSTSEGRYIWLFLFLRLYIYLYYSCVRNELNNMSYIKNDFHLRPFPERNSYFIQQGIK